MDIIYNPVYKRLECKLCGEGLDFISKHICKKPVLTELDIFWGTLSADQKEKYRKQYNLLPDIEYQKYIDVADYAYFLIKGGIK